MPSATGVSRTRVCSASRVSPSSTGRAWDLAEPVVRRMTSVPVMSDGIKSGVNCTRLKDRRVAEAKVLINRVLAKPGTPSSNA